MTASSQDSPPGRLALSVALLTAAMLLIEIIATRLFSVLFFYHYSFFAISLVMSGLAFGGLVAARWNLRTLSLEAFHQRLAVLAALFSATTLGAMLLIVALPIQRAKTVGLGTVALFALAFVPGLVAAGAYLAAAFARNEAWIGRLYAADLVAAGLGCFGAILLMRVLQGPASLLAACLLAALAALALRPRGLGVRAAGLLLALVCAAGMGGHVATGGRFLRLPFGTEPLIERWNEHSRLIALPGEANEYIRFMIDKTAATDLLRVPPRAPGERPRLDEAWGKGVNHVAYRLGRPLDRVAVIGSGGGRDLLAAMVHGARHVDGYELNGLILDLLRNEYRGFSDLATWPEISLIHGEARVGIARSARRYDVIQASLIDTWAATAGGGFVLSENSLYTVDGWRTFLASLSETGLLTMSRFNIPEAPAEIHRLASLAAEALSQAGIGDVASHLVLLSDDPGTGGKRLHHVHATVIVSRIPFSSGEVGRLREICDSEGMVMLAAPGGAPQDPIIAELTASPARRAAAIAASPFDISPPTDLRPYFFMQIRPRDVMSLMGRREGYVLNITFKAVRVMMFLGGVALAFALGVMALAALSLPSPSATAAHRSVYRWMAVYFLAIGFGYMLIQLGIHQRLIIILGHPTLALAVVLSSLLLGTGVGSYVSKRLFPDSRMPAAWVVIVVVVGLLALVFPALSGMEGIGSPAGRAVLCGILTGAVGLVLGFAFPLGVRIVAPSGEWAVQRMWAINGAASIAGSAVAAILGVSFGSRAVVATGFAFYLLVAVCGIRAATLRRRTPEALVPAWEVAARPERREGATRRRGRA